MKEDTGLKEKPRRHFLKILWAVLGLAALGEFVWLVYSFFRPVPEKQKRAAVQALIDAGTIDSYTPGTVSVFVAERFYLVCLEDGGFLALSGRCTHLGCSVPWDDEKKKFICPCHASVFDIFGNVISSPAPRALDFFDVTIENGRIFVDTRKALKRNRFSKTQAAYPETIRVAKEKDGAS